MKSWAELCWLNASFTEQVVILEEFLKSNSVTFDDVLYLFHQINHFLGSIVIYKFSVICWFCTCIWAVYNILLNVTVFQKFSVLNVIDFITINKWYQFCLMLTQWETVCCQNLSENLGCYFKMSVQVKILEETLSIKSVFTDYFLKISNNLLNSSTLILSWFSTAIICKSPGIIEAKINIFFKLFLCEDLINTVRENLPTNVFSSFWRLEVFS